MSRRGFTLIEVMVSMVIMSVGLLAVLKMAYVYVASNTRNLERGQASVRAQDKMEQLRSYAVSDRVDKFSVFDFDYVVSTSPTFTTVLSPPSTDIPIPGLLSGPAGSPVTTPWGTVYEVLYDDGTHGDTNAGDGTYTNSDVGYGQAGLQVNRVYSVKPYPVGSTRPTYAILTVTSTWTDKSGDTSSIELKSVINRRQ